LSSPVIQLEEQIATWPHVSVAPHRFGGREFRFGKAEIGHVHFWGDVDIPFPRAIHDLPLADRLAARHRWLPDSGWITFHMSSAADLDHALWLMRLSWLRYALKLASDPALILNEESARLHLSPTLVALLSRFMQPQAQPTALAVARRS
jgi:Luciferase